MLKSKYFIHAAGINYNSGEVPSAEEHFGISIIESLLNNCIPICANRGFPPYYIENNKNGFLFDNLEELKLIIDDLINNNIKINEEYCIKYNKKICEKFNIENYISNISNIMLNI